ncbi:hypothetical protein [Telluribacter humicola]
MIPRIQLYSQQLDNMTLLADQQWVMLNKENNSRVVYIFRKNGQLIISNNGKVDKANWEFLGNNTLLVDQGKESYLYKHGFFDETVLVLKVDGMDDYVVFVNEVKFDKGVKSLESIATSLENKYIKKNVNNDISIDAKTLRKENINNVDNSGSFDNIFWFLLAFILGLLFIYSIAFR